VVYLWATDFGRQLHRIIYWFLYCLFLYGGWRDLLHFLRWWTSAMAFNDPSYLAASWGRFFLRHLAGAVTHDGSTSCRRFGLLRIDTLVAVVRAPSRRRAFCLAVPVLPVPCIPVLRPTCLHLCLPCPACHYAALYPHPSFARISA